MATSLTEFSTPSTSGLIAEWIHGDPDKSRDFLHNIVIKVVGPTEKSNGLPSVITRIIVDYLEHFQCFGEGEWTALCGRVAPPPGLPDDFVSLWHGPCPIFPGKKIRETHMLVYIPTHIDGKSLTLKRFGEIAKRYFPKNEDGFRHSYPMTIEDFKGRSFDNSCWVLMTKDVVPGSRKNFSSVRKLFAKHVAKEVKAAYEVPQVLEAAVCVLAQFLSSKMRLFSDNPVTYTICREIFFDNHHMIVGGFSPDGLDLRWGYYFEKEIGAAVLRKFYGP